MIEVIVSIITNKKVLYGLILIILIIGIFYSGYTIRGYKSRVELIEQREELYSYFFSSEFIDSILQGNHIIDTVIVPKFIYKEYNPEILTTNTGIIISGPVEFLYPDGTAQAICKLPEGSSVGKGRVGMIYDIKLPSQVIHNIPYPIEKRIFIKDHNWKDIMISVLIAFITGFITNQFIDL